MVIAHGFGEHGGCYRHVAEVLGPALEIDLLAPDLRGHGRSPGRRGVVKTYDDLTVDLRSGLEWAARVRPRAPRFVLGHSNGGQLALRVALNGAPPVAGLILSNPALKLATAVPRYKLHVGRFLHRFAPGVTLSAKLPADRLTRDPLMQHHHRVDPLRHNRISAPLFFGMTEGGAAISENANAISMPTLMLLGGADPVIDPEESRRAFERIGSVDKTLMIYPKMLHEPLNEVGREQVFADITRWLEPYLEEMDGNGR
jgi:alpha-beta hydrolase superfamily lysophospholipase